MPRTVTINGKTVALDAGLKPAPRFSEKEKSDFVLLLEAMEIGESVYLPTREGDGFSSGCMSQVGKRLGRFYSQRKEGPGTRIYCLQREENPYPQQRAPSKKAPTPKATRSYNAVPRSIWG